MVRYYYIEPLSDKNIYKEEAIMSFRHRITGFLLALALVLQLVPGIPLVTRAEGQNAVSRVIVDGEGILSGQYMVSGTHQVRDTKPETGGYLYYEDGYLVLENFFFNSSSYNTIESEAALTIELVGENTLIGNYLYTIRHTTEEPLVIQGEGSLTAIGRTGCISAYGDVTLNANISAATNDSFSSAIGCNGDLYINGGSVSATNTGGRAVSSKNLYMNGGVLEATGSTRGISTKILEINGGDLTAISTDTASDSQNYAIQVGQSLPEFYIHNNIGAHIAASTEPDGPIGTADLNDWKSYDYVRIYDAGVDVDGVHLSSGEYLLQGSDTPATGTPTGSYALYEGGVLTLNDFEGGGIHSFGDLKLNVQGTNRLSGQAVMDSGVTVSGTGNLRIDVSSEEAAVLVHDTLTVESGTLVITNAVGWGCELDSLDINNGNVTINGGVLAYGMLINNGSCRITSDSAYPAVEIIPIDETSTGSVALYGGSLELSSAQTSALVGPLSMAGGEFFAETGAAGCRVVTDRLVPTNWDGYEYLCADQPGGELVPCYENEMGQFSRIRIGLHKCAPTLVEEIKPTCGDSGKLAYYRCFCGKYYEDAAGTILIPYIYEYGNLDPLGHDVEGVEYTVTDDAHYKLCKVCGAQELSTRGYHDFGDGLYCVCGYARMGNIYGVVTNEIATTVTFRLWQGDTLVKENFAYGQNVSYGLRNIEPGTYRLEVECIGYALYEAEIVMDRYQVEHNVVLPPKINTISGSVSSDIGWTDPVTLNLYRQGNLLQTVTTEGSPAYFTFENVPTGIYWMEIIKKDHEYVYSEIEITESSDAWNLMLSVLRGDITGTVNCDVYANSQAHLELHMDGELAGMTGVSPNGGSFDLIGYPVGSYLLTVTLPGYKTVELPVQLSTSGVHLDITMEALKANVFVTVYSSGSEDEEIRLQVMDSGTEIRSYAICGTEAAVLMEDLPLGDYRLIVTKAGHETVDTLLRVLEGGGSMTVPLRALTGSLSGRITTSDGAEVDATVEILRNGKVVKTVQSTDSYSFDDLLAGSYTVRVSMAGYESVELSLELEEGIYTQDIQLEPVASEGISSVAGKITCFLTDGEVKVELLQDGKIVHTVVVTGKKADFVIEGVENGTYTMRITKENHTPLEKTVEIGEAPLDLNVKICPVGDATGDGTVNIKDFQRMLRHINKTSPLTDYALACGDLTGDGQCNIKDFQKLLRHINKTSPLF